jgi:hypothetical protein
MSTGRDIADQDSANTDYDRTPTAQGQFTMPPERSPYVYLPLDAAGCRYTTDSSYQAPPEQGRPHSLRDQHLPTRRCTEFLRSFVYVGRAGYKVQGDYRQKPPYHPREPPPMSARTRDEEEGYLWIDQTCINQSDVEERNAQVRLMSTIYSQCLSVIVWLGGGDPSLFEAARTLNNQEDYRSLCTLFRNDYFARLWVVQEVMLANALRILCKGRIWVSWK